MNTFYKSMGIKMTPNYANLFMTELECQFLSNLQHQPKLYARFIDDIYLIWDNGYQNFLHFFDAINNLHDSIKFTHEISLSNFLDVKITKTPLGLQNKLYTKPTEAMYLYLHFNSFHPQHLKRSIPYSEAIRMCSTMSEFDTHTANLKKNLLYSKELSRTHN